MKRDLDLIRQILLGIEKEGEKEGEPEGEDSSRRAGFANIADDGYDPESIQYHVQLMHDAGLIVADELVPGQWWPERITWAGHEFLDLARNDTLWQATKRDVESKVGSAPFRVVRDLLARRVNDQLTPNPRSRKK